MSMRRLSGFLVQSSLLCTSLMRSGMETSASSSRVFSLDIGTVGLRCSRAYRRRGCLVESGGGGGVEWSGVRFAELVAASDLI